MNALLKMRDFYGQKMHNFYTRVGSKVLDKMTGTESQIEFTEFEEDFIAIFANEIFLPSDTWYASQKTIIKFIREVDTNNFPVFGTYKKLKDWELAYLIDCFVIREIALSIGFWNGSENWNPKLKKLEIQVLSKYFVGKFIADNEFHEYGFDSIQPLIKKFGKKGLKNEGSLRNW